MTRCSSHHPHPSIFLALWLLWLCIGISRHQLTTSSCISFMNCIPFSVIIQRLPQTSSSRRVVIKPSVAATATMLADSRANLDLVVKPVAHDSTKHSYIASRAISVSTSSSVGFGPCSSHAVLSFDGESDFKRFASFFRASSSDITDMIWVSFHCHLYFVMYPTEDRDI